VTTEGRRLWAVLFVIVLYGLTFVPHQAADPWAPVQPLPFSLPSVAGCGP
jgi:hypothetical protein